MGSILSVSGEQASPDEQTPQGESSNASLQQVATPLPADVPNLQQAADVLNLQQTMLNVSRDQQCMQMQQQIPQRRGSRRSQNLSMAMPRFGGSSPLPSMRESFCDDDILVDDAVARAAAAATQPEPEIAPSVDAAVSLSTSVEYKSLARGTNQDVFGLITLQGRQAPAPEADPGRQSSSERQPMDLTCVLDVSGSMGGQKIQQVQDAVRCVTAQCTAKDRLSIVSFNHNAQRISRLQKMDVEGKDAATAATFRLSAGGGTSIASGLDVGLSVMEQRRQRNKVSAILLLTDGQDRSAQYQLPNLLARASAARCAVYAFGFGQDHDATLLGNIAEQAHTPFTYVEDTEKIQEAFSGAVGGLSSVVAQNIELSIAGAVTVKTVHTGFTVQRTSDASVAVTIPDLYAGERRDVLVELSVPADREGQTKLLDVHARYTDLNSDRVIQTAPVEMLISCVDEPQPEDEPDLEVHAQRERVEITQALQAASLQSDQGNFGGAQEMLESAGARMKSKRVKTRMNDALCEEIDDARERMRNSSMWERGGRAEVFDACQMHTMQRATNLNVSSKSAVKKSSKAMYCNASSVSWMASSKRQG